MKNILDKKEARDAARALKLECNEVENYVFSHVFSFSDESRDGNGELRCRDTFASVAASELCRYAAELPHAEVRFSGTAADIASAVNNGEKSAADIVKEYLSRVREDKYGAYITVMEKEAAAIAGEVDCRVKRGERLSLAGVPVAVKDNICTAGTLTTCASRALAEFVPDYDATVYARLVRAGAVPVGKTNLDEFAVGSDGSTSYFGVCRNPLDTSRTPGGSSSGSAAAIASHSAVIALGSDTGGSARIPASYCGLASLKPTYGAFSRFGLVGMATSLEQICPMAKRVSDLRAVFEVCAGRDERDMTTCVNFGKRDGFGKIGVFLPEGASSAAWLAVEECVGALEKAGYASEAAELPYFETVLDAYYVISSAEAASNLARYDGLRYGFAADGADINETRIRSFGKALRERLSEGTYVLAHADGAPYARALEMRERIKEAFAELFTRYDLIVTPMAESEAVRFGESVYDSERYAVYANLTGVPAVTFPASKGKTGLPVGVQLMADRGEDIFLLNIAEEVERRLGYEKL